MRKKFPALLQENLFAIALGVAVWMMLGNLAEHFLPLSAYRKFVSPVTRIEAQLYRCGKGRWCERTDLVMSASSRNFILVEGAGRGAYIGDVIPGDTVTLYTRSWLTYLLSFGRYNTIYQLEKNGQVLYPISYRRTIAMNYFYVAGLASLVLFIMLVADLQVRNEKKHRRQMQSAYLDHIDRESGGPVRLDEPQN